MNKRKFHTFIILIFLISIFTAVIIFSYVRSQKPSEMLSKKHTILELATYTKDDPGFDSLLQSFMVEYPNIKVSANSYNEEIYNNIIKSSISSGLGPDLFELDGMAALNSYISTEFLLNLDDFISLDDRTDEEKNYCCISKDKIFATPPLSREAFVILVNEKICETYNISILPKSFEDFFNDCKNLLEEGVVPIAFGSKDLSSVRNLATQVLFTHNNVALSSQPSFEELYSYKNAILDLRSYFPRDFYYMDYNDAKLMFVKGEAAFLFGMESDVYRYSKLARGFKIRDFALYQDNLKGTLYKYRHSYAVNTNSLNKIESIEFAKYLSNIKTKKKYIFYNQRLKYLIYKDMENPDWADKYAASWVYKYMDSDLEDFDAFLEKLQSDLID